MSDVSRIERSSRSESSVPSPIDGIETPVFNLKLAGTDILRNRGMWGGGGRNEGLEVHLYKGHFFPADQVSDLETPHRGDGGGFSGFRRRGGLEFQVLSLASEQLAPSSLSLGPLLTEAPCSPSPGQWRFSRPGRSHVVSLVLIQYIYVEIFGSGVRAFLIDYCSSTARTAPVGTLYKTESTQ